MFMASRHITWRFLNGTCGRADLMSSFLFGGRDATMESQHAEVASSRARWMRCGFLFNHDQLHQIAHSAPVAFELMRHYPSVETRLLTTTPAQLEYLHCLLERSNLSSRCLTLLRLPRSLRVVAPALDRAIPFSRVAMLFANSKCFEEL